MDKRVSEVLEKIRLTRVNKGISIMELANRAGMSRSQIYYLETKKKIPTLSILFRLADALEIDIIELFDN